MLIIVNILLPAHSPLFFPVIARGCMLLAERQRSGRKYPQWGQENHAAVHSPPFLYPVGIWGTHVKLSGSGFKSRSTIWDSAPLTTRLRGQTSNVLLKYLFLPGVYKNKIVLNIPKFSFPNKAIDIFYISY